MEPVLVDGSSLTIADVHRVAAEHAPCVLDPAAGAAAAASRAALEARLRAGEPIYGVTTGYGAMVNTLVDGRYVAELQANLIRSHSTAVGPLFSPVEVRAIMLARLNALARGYSAVRPALLERLVLYLDRGIIPAVPEIGSLGASGDLAPLAHLAGAVTGEGYVLHRGERTATAAVLGELGLPGFTLQAKEGLALINGTSAMTGVGALLLGRALDQVRTAEIAAALSIEALRASAGPFAAAGHELGRPHPGQIDVAADLRALLEGSARVAAHTDLTRAARAWQHRAPTAPVVHTPVELQQVYTLRAVPQVLGAVRDALGHAVRTVEIELNSANDNPLVFDAVLPEEDVFHGANFHGQPVAFVMDHTMIALTQLGVFSERRTNRLLHGALNGELPEFLVAGDVGLHSGLAGAQYTATALVAENRTIGPASTQSVPSNADNQDVVSMGLIAARGARRVLANNAWIVAVELLCAAQAVDLSGGPDGLGPAGLATYDAVRGLVAPLDGDRFLADDLDRLAGAVTDGTIVARCPVALR